MARAFFLLMGFLFSPFSFKGVDLISLIIMGHSQNFIQPSSEGVQLEFGSFIEQSENGEKYFEGPFGISIGFDQRIYIADDLSHTIYIFHHNHALLKTIGKRGQKAGEFAWVDAVISDGQGTLYIADTGNDRIQILDNLGNPLKTFGRNGTGSEEFSNPRGLALDSENNMYVADWGNHRVQVFDPQGKFLRKFGELGSNTGQLNSPICIYIDQKDQIFIWE